MRPDGTPSGSGTVAWRLRGLAAEGTAGGLTETTLVGRFAVT
ncbi:hypothetical protein BN6_24760 [Saccharothrix espanaensis DSM 44229]|uniref:Uncharacterized protein n=1 Tax=Saccharothrix espanaensis (strain ATCC 51144 / DSM 44229 / JCM 9112 / NBRC 15066 / NRRL 15764) TaxID=1179773 RepID=K0JQQ6_SACES|nr:hypothetical protein BN6_24760 [Saccharothrix espanaensis DSM 44229]